MHRHALAQGPYLKIRWAVGFSSRGRLDRRSGVEEACVLDDGGARLSLDSFSGYRRLDEKSYCNGVNRGICDTFTEGITMRSTVQGDRTGLPSTPGVFHGVESRWAKFGGSSRPLNACEKKADAIDFQRKSQRNEIFRCESDAWRLMRTRNSP